ncbi:peptide chain release factor N(5)-glutamine methyltransferase [Candidatus Daviesbacteria bacterium]|nr:peptide chain release factor N(5)-glutamine methyltransferase [Candidatus Daviesbacteria bacterium]
MVKFWNIMKKGTTLKSEIQRIQSVSEQPKQYAQGWTEFYKLKFYLTRDVLIPRPETELLVDVVFSLCHPQPDLLRQQMTSSAYGGSILKMDSRFRGNDIISILDVGTGSGCIAIAIAKNLPNSKIIATDVSKKALEVAQKNAKFHKVYNKIFFLESDLLDIFSEQQYTPPSEVRTTQKIIESDNQIHRNSESPSHSESFRKLDIIVANLPYIPTARLMYIDPMVTDWEPKIALDGDKDGFQLYRRMFAQMKKFNIIPKYLIAEIDYAQSETAVLETFRFFPQAKPEIKLDLAKKQRILIVKF